MPFLKPVYAPETMKRYSPKKLRENMLAYSEQLNKEHVGHIIQFYANSTSENYAKLIRASAQDINGYMSVALFVENPDSPFPIKVWLDQVRSCSCITGKGAL